MNDVWLSIGIGLLTALGGGTGVAQLIRIWQDRKLALSERTTKSAELEIREEDAIDLRWREFVKSHGELIVTPLREQIDGLRAELKRQGEEITTLKAELDRRDRELEKERTTRWRAIAYIRELLLYIRTHLPDAATPVPEPHSDVAAEI